MIDSLVDFLAKEWTETLHTSQPLKRRFLKKIWWAASGYVAVLRGEAAHAARLTK
jgi:hypothetical protein